MKVKEFLKALKNDVPIVIKDSDNTQVAEFYRNSYKAVSDEYLGRDIDDFEIIVKNAVTVVITLDAAAVAPAEPPADTGNGGTTTPPTEGTTGTEQA